MHPIRKNSREKSLVLTDNRFIIGVEPMINTSLAMIAYVTNKSSLLHLSFPHRYLHPVLNLTLANQITHLILPFNRESYLSTIFTDWRSHINKLGSASAWNSLIRELIKYGLVLGAALLMANRLVRVEAQLHLAYHLPLVWSHILLVSVCFTLIQRAVEILLLKSPLLLPTYTDTWLQAIPAKTLTLLLNISAVLQFTTLVSIAILTSSKLVCGLFLCLAILQAADFLRNDAAMRFRIGDFIKYGVNKENYTQVCTGLLALLFSTTGLCLLMRVMPSYVNYAALSMAMPIPTLTFICASFAASAIGALMASASVKYIPQVTQSIMDFLSCATQPYLNKENDGSLEYQQASSNAHSFWNRNTHQTSQDNYLEKNNDASEVTSTSPLARSS